MELKYLIGIGGYLALMLFIGYWVKNKISTAEDYLVGGRSFNTLYNTATVTSIALGGSVVVIVPGATYAYGIWNDELLWGSLINLAGGSIFLFIGAIFFMPKLWRLKLLSLGDFYYGRYSRTTGILATVLISFTFIFWVAVQVLVFAKVAGSILDWPFLLSIFVSVTVICAYTLMGGLWAVCITDIVQVGLILLGLVVLTPMAISAVGGWDAFVAGIPQEKMQIFPKTHTPEVWLAWIAAWVMLGLGSISTPDLSQRSFSAKSPEVARRSGLLAGTIVLISLIVVTGLAYATSMLIDLGTVPGEQINEDPELILPVLFKTILPPYLTVFFLGACLAAVMSCADSALLALSGMISKNIVKDVFLPKLSDKGLVRATRFFVLTCTIIGAVMAVSLPSAFTLMALGFDLITCSLFAPLTLGLYWKKANAYGAIAGMLASIIVRVGGSGLQYGFTLEGIAFTGDSWYVYTLAGPAVCFVTMFAVSLLTQKANPPRSLDVFTKMHREESEIDAKALIEEYPVAGRQEV